MPSSRYVLWMAAVSGLASYGLVWLAGYLSGQAPLPPDVLRYAPGFLFGLLVMQPGSGGAGRRWGIVLMYGLIWIFSYRLAVSLVVDHDESTLLACGLAGGVAAGLGSLAVRLLRPRRLSLLAMLMAFVSGTLGGCLIGQGLLEPEPALIAQCLVAAGFVVWQVGVGGSLLLVDELGENEKHA